MRPAHARTAHVATALVSVTGLGYGVMRYLVRPTDPFSVVNHPWQPHLQHLHVVTAPFLVFALGLLVAGHVTTHVRRGELQRRRSGLTMVASATPMILTGYLLQVSVDEWWRKTWILLHVVTSLLWLLAYLGHLLSSRP